MAWTKEQEQAISMSGSNIIVSAGAGSGKTAVLTTRVLNKISNGVHVDELLILTFTNAAAGEMKERIKKKIKEEHFDEELERLDQAYITTFDSFALSCVKKYHYLLNIPKEIGITDASIIDLQKKRILHEVFDELYDQEDSLFLHLIHDFCLKEDNSFQEEILSLSNTLEIRLDRDNFLAHYISNFYNDTIYQKILDAYLDILKNRLEDIFSEIHIQKNYFEQDYYETLKDSFSSHFQAQCLDEYIGQILSYKMPSLPKGSEEESKIAKKKINDLFKKLKDQVQTYGYHKDILENYIATQDYLQALIFILKQYYLRLDHWKQEHFVFDFGDIARMAYNVLRENQNIRDELKYSFHEIMIDEYQDTSDIQEAFISLIENNNVYMVGDIKQSIYRFRNANPYIFKNKYDSYSQGIGGLKIDLLKNFRSRKEVLEDINTIFNPIMTDSIGNAAYMDTHQMVFGNTLYETSGKTIQNNHMEILEYELNSKEYSKDEIEIFAIAKDILKKIKTGYLVFDKDDNQLRKVIWDDFCIIMDRNVTFDLTKKIFESFGIPLAMYKDEVIHTNMDIYLLKNLIQFLIHINEKNYDTQFSYAFVSIARSFLYRIPDEEIFDFIQKKNFWDSSIFKDISPVVSMISSYSAKEIIEKILEKTKFYEKSITTGNVTEKKTCIETILNLCENAKNLHYDIYLFYEFLSRVLKEKQILKVPMNISNDHAVKIMNIHKSKGLEFPICYFAGLYKKFSKEDIKGNLIYEKNEPIYMPNCHFGIQETIIKLLIQDKINKDDISEKIRLFYVGLTRAKEKMIFLLPKKDDCAEIKTEEGVLTESIRYRYQSLADLIYSLPNTLKIYKSYISLSSLDLSKGYKSVHSNDLCLENNMEAFDVKEISIEPFDEKPKEKFSKDVRSLITKEEKRNIELGLEIHKVLEFLDLKNFQSEEISNPFIRNLIDSMLQQDLFQNIHQANIYQEYEFIYEDSQTTYHGIIDLMLEYDDHIDLIDYKLNDVTDTHYIDQLSGYKAYIERMTKKEVHSYLFSILSSSIKKLN